MKIKLSELKKIIQEETLSEAWHGANAERTIGLYFNVARHKAALHHLDRLYQDALTDAIADLGNEDEAMDAVNRGIDRILQRWLSEKM